MPQAYESLSPTCTRGLHCSYGFSIVRTVAVITNTSEAALLLILSETGDTVFTLSEIVHDRCAATICIAYNIDIGITLH